VGQRQKAQVQAQAEAEVLVLVLVLVQVQLQLQTELELRLLAPWSQQPGPRAPPAAETSSVSKKLQGDQAVSERRATWW